MRFPVLALAAVLTLAALAGRGRPADPPPTPYAVLYARVAKGEVVTVRVGPGGLQCEELRGVRPGLYRCYRGPDGAPRMEPCVECVGFR